MIEGKREIGDGTNCDGIVLDGWWAEAFDGENGFAIGGEGNIELEYQDEMDLEASTAFWKRWLSRCFTTATEGIPHRWIARQKRARCVRWRGVSVRGG